MDTTKQTKDIIPAMKRGQINSYRPEDIRRWGVERFLQTTTVNEPFFGVFPDFTEAENEVMDALLAEGDKGGV
ncbi:hypothetical protein [Spirosoma rhododendri]|uniref:Uncharacterized protein n=1 Tax=Spirosoma rhododendri TaxID=2728024 RepID=A0A7L5DPM2_9BACT|nr:hypothetical protein [Spirosoma rhododendri]QJD77977.1 hypothetical protein HH216_05740 [Spirosoma rhododendri]